MRARLLDHFKNDSISEDVEYLYEQNNSKNRIFSVSPTSELLFIYF